MECCDRLEPSFFLAFRLFDPRLYISIILVVYFVDASGDKRTAESKDMPAELRAQTLNQKVLSKCSLNFPTIQ